MITIDSTTALEKEIFLAALQKPIPGERARFLDSACAGNAVLRRRIEELLAIHSDADSFMAQPASDRANALSPYREKPGTQIGRYKLLEQIGEGGCGVVYLAEQSEPVKRRVALKVIKLGMDTKQVVTRFEGERQALAMMDHPNIARVFDGGATENGRPYFVMEMVRGVPITKYCDENQLSTRERLDVFLRVCEAVQHAHQKGIIHRDLKPSNILIAVNEGKAGPKVIDFGIAKATQGKLTEETIHTWFHQLIGTPAYMSPEQAETSLDIDTRSDIYSLGIVLYELLTGKPPFDNHELLTAGVDEMRRIIREQEPGKPSSVVEGKSKLRVESGNELRAAGRKMPSPGQLQPLSTDLDWIVMKCLDKDRSRRYETANGLARDIERHLNDEPVLACPPSRAYRFRKFVQRNQLPFLTATLLALMLILAVVVSSWHAVRARRAERVAKQQTAKATASEQTAREQLARAMQAEEVSRTQVEIARSVKEFLTVNLLGGGMNPIGSPEMESLDDASARALLDRVARKIEGQFPDQPLIEAEIRAALVLAYVARADFTHVASEGEKVVAIRQRHLGPTHSDTLEAIASLAGARFQIGQRAEALKLLKATIDSFRTSANEVSVGQGTALLRYSYLLCRANRPEEALPYAQEALALLRKTIDSKDPKRMLLLQAAGDVAQITQRIGNKEEAEKLWREALTESRKAHSEHHPMTVQFEFAIARLLVEQNRSAQALPMLEQVVAFNRLLLKPLDHILSLDAQFWLGRAYENQNRLDDAFTLFGELWPKLIMHLPHESAEFCCRGIADFYKRHQRTAEAEAISQALTQRRGVQQEHPPPSSRVD